MYSKDIEDSKQNEKRKIFATSDWHGNLRAVINALYSAKLIDKKENWIGGNSILINLGDICDRGIDSKGCIDLILKLKKQAKKANGQVITLMGNHCKMIIDGIKIQGWLQCWIDNGGIECIDSYVAAGIVNESDSAKISAEKILEYHKEYFDNLEQFKIIGDSLFVHAGVDPRGNLESLTRDLQVGLNGPVHLWIRDQFYKYPDLSFLENYGVERVFYGHSPSCWISGDRKSLMKPHNRDNKLIGIDIGAYYDNGGVCIIEVVKDSYKVAGVCYNLFLE